MTIRRIVLLVFFTVAALVPAASQETANPQPERVAADTPRATPGGATFMVPTGWSIAAGKDLIVLAPPEADTHIAIVDSQAADAAAAVAAAWAAYKPDAKRPLKLVTPRPAREGWDERQVFNYETSPNERVVVFAIAQRAGKAWTVIIADGTEPTFEKRNSPINLVFQSLRPKGYNRESFAGRKAQPLDAAHIAQLKAFVEDSMKELGIPGASIALVDGGKVVYEGGFGVREMGKPERVDENTLFMAASNTKGMTTLLLAELVDEKKLRWDEPVTEAYPSFKLGDADTTKKVLVKNLICACTGLPRQDLEWIFQFKDATPQSSLALLGTMQPTSKFGEVFQYSNLMASAAGYIGAHLVYPNKELGAAYDEAMQKKIFDPLGMKSTTFDMKRALSGNHASPHGDTIDGNPSLANIAFDYSVMPHRPAGGVWTSAHDLIRYVQLELAQGKLPDGKQLVSAENLLARRAPQVPLGEDGAYGMGLMVDRTWRVPVVHHGGSMAGYKSDIMLLPDSGIGAVILTNSDNGGMLLRPFMRRLLEVLFDGKAEAVGNVSSAATTHKAYIVKERERLVAPADPTFVKQLAARYSSKELGEIAVLNNGGTITFDFGEWKSTVASRKNDDGTVSFITIDPTNDGFEFVVGERSGKRVLVIRDGQHEYVFTEA
ncbi:MAG TPA: serine hydrolase domain-containing protein [Candidatus Angelobacter sp.]|nr:serine hydrolase domain-containing protein [Candidatus Angelobacter sp.]